MKFEKLPVQKKVIPEVSADCNQLHQDEARERKI